MRSAWPLIAFAVAALALLVAASPITEYRPAPDPTMTTPSPTSPEPSPTFTETQRAALTRALDRYCDDRPGRLSVSVRDLSTGLSYTYGANLRTATASIVKVNLVMALLLQAQRDERALSSAEKYLAERAIKVSDNDAATALWHAIGAADGLASANRDLGLRDTVPGDAWGSTTTGSADQLRLLSALTSGDGPLSATGRRYLRRLMADVTPEQAWGVSAAGDTAALKNGWLPRRIHGNRWTVNSIGVVRDGDRTFLIAVISERHPTMADGIRAVEHAARTVTGALTPPTER